MRIENINNTSFNAKFKIDSNGNLQRLWKNSEKKNFTLRSEICFDYFQTKLPKHEIEILRIFNRFGSNSKKAVDCFNNTTGENLTIDIDENNKIPLIEQLVINLITHHKSETEHSKRFWDSNTSFSKLFRTITGQQLNENK